MIKYLPWSPKTYPDQILLSVQPFISRQIVVFTLMDGINTTFTQNSISPPDKSIESIYNNIKDDIPDNYKFMGENLYNTKSIFYDNLLSHFLLHSIYNHHDICLSWDETVEWAELLDLKTLPVIFRGEFNPSLLKQLYHPIKDGNACLGYVVRVAGSFYQRSLDQSAAKYVTNQVLPKPSQTINLLKE